MPRHFSRGVWAHVHVGPHACLHRTRHVLYADHISILCCRCTAIGDTRQGVSVQRLWGSGAWEPADRATPAVSTQGLATRPATTCLPIDEAPCSPVVYSPTHNSYPPMSTRGPPMAVGY